MCVAQNRAYIGIDEDIAIIDTTTPAAPTMLGTLNIGAFSLDLSLQGTTLAAATDRGGVVLLDVSAPMAASQRFGKSRNRPTANVCGTYRGALLAAHYLLEMSVEMAIGIRLLGNAGRLGWERQPQSPECERRAICAIRKRATSGLE